MKSLLLVIYPCVGHLMEFGVLVAQGMVASGLDSPYLLEQIKSLKSTVGWLKEENQIFRSKEMKVRDQCYSL